MINKADAPELIDGKIGSKVVFDEDCSLIGIILWAVSRFEPNANGIFKTVDHNGALIPPSVYKKFQDDVHASIQELERIIFGHD